METIITKDVVIVSYEALNQLVTDYVLSQGKKVSGGVAFALDGGGKWFAVMEVERRNVDADIPFADGSKMVTHEDGTQQLVRPL